MAPSGSGLWHTGISWFVEAVVQLQMLSCMESRLRVSRASSFSRKARNLDIYVTSLRFKMLPPNFKNENYCLDFKNKPVGWMKSSSGWNSNSCLLVVLP